MPKAKDVVSLFFQVKPYSGKYLTTVEHDSIRIDSGKNLIHWNSLGMTFDPYTFLAYMGLDENEILKLGVELPERPLDLSIGDNYIPEYDSMMFYGKNEYHPYLKNRCVSEETAELFKLSIAENGILIPFERNNNRFGCAIRLFEPKNIKYMTYVNGTFPNIYPDVSFYNKPSGMAERIAFIFEGYFSVFRWTQFFRNIGKNNIDCYSLMKARVNGYSLLSLENYKKHFYIPDTDLPGLEVARELNELFPYVKIRKPPKMPDEMNAEEIKTFLNMKGN